MNPQSEQKRIAFGYNRGPSNQVEINEGQAAAVKLIFDWYCEGKSLAQIAELLTDMHVPTAHNRQTWGRQALANILSNRHYIGEDRYPAIIYLEQFRAAQKIKKQRSGRT